VNDLTALYAGYQAELYTLPTELVDAYERFATAQAQLHDGEPGYTQTKVDRLAEKAARLTAYGNADQIITEHLQPALDRQLSPFVDDVHTLGSFAGHANLTPDLVNASDEVRTAFTRYQRVGDWYAPLRAAWRWLRRSTPTDDPRGVDSHLAEFANLPALYTRWNQIGAAVNNGIIIAPWQGSADYLRLAWAVKVGARVWLPTAAQQSKAYQDATRPTAPTHPSSSHTERLPAIAAT
jgi:hypothetical protein